MNEQLEKYRKYIRRHHKEIFPAIYPVVVPRYEPYPHDVGRVVFIVNESKTAEIYVERVEGEYLIVVRDKDVS